MRSGIVLWVVGSNYGLLYRHFEIVLMSLCEPMANEKVRMIRSYRNEEGEVLTEVGDFMPEIRRHF